MGFFIFTKKKMLKDSLTIRLRHERFVKTICETEIVYALKDADGYASTSSNHYEDENDEPITVICFWADKALANSCIQGHWSRYKLEEISLVNFTENWCVGMGNDGLLMGTSFDQNMFGYEADPYELVLEIAAELQKQNKTLAVTNYESLEELTDQLEEILGDLEDEDAE